MLGVPSQHSLLTATLATAAVVASLALLFYRPKAHRTIPGPAGVPFVGNAFQLSAYGKELHRLWPELDAKFGKISALRAAGQLLVIVRDTDVAKLIFNNATDFVRNEATQRAMRYSGCNFVIVRSNLARKLGNR
jgi:hypothetical protein